MVSYERTKKKPKIEMATPSFRLRLYPNSHRKELVNKFGVTLMYIGKAGKTFRQFHKHVAWANGICGFWSSNTGCQSSFSMGLTERVPQLLRLKLDVSFAHTL